MKTIKHNNIKQWAIDLGFNDLGITDIDLSVAESRLKQWLAKQYHGTMDYMERHGTMRSRPEELLPGTLRAIVLSMDYLTADPKFNETLENPTKAFISRYAQNSDYHKLIRKRLQKLATKIQTEIGEHNYRVFTDSAPVMEKPLAEKAGLGWIAKHTNLINSKNGSYFFLAVIYTDMPLEVSKPQTKSHCGSCTACISACPTNAIVGPYQLDARKCISYLTIENKGDIPIEYRKAMGNRIYGCDDCQIVCPWNKFAKTAAEIKFHATESRGLLEPDLIKLFNWDEATFLKNTEGSAIRRIGHDRWLRNIAVALGNAPKTPEVISALKNKLDHPSELVRSHVQWAVNQSL